MRRIHKLSMLCVCHVPCRYWRPFWKRWVHARLVSSVGSSARRRAFFPPSSSLALPTVGVSRFHRPLRSNMSASAEAAPDPGGDPASPLWRVGEGNPPGDDVVVQSARRNASVTLEVKGETQLRNLSNKLKKEGIDHKLWVEQPDDFPACLLTRPYPKSQKTETAVYVKESHNRMVQVNPRRLRGASAVG
ncbi:hypothetical protein OPV22_028470 [Ensete ventricosum]|uniref:peptidyl-tRNA hydrolase n=1 Tax=Ensete ventricosum TaxID=4639 RepID=A0AAV8Q8H0_ENSVE|nr:hypothetical protein OPV22_028470 [Ensete ventricosum]